MRAIPGYGRVVIRSTVSLSFYAVDCMQNCRLVINGEGSSNEPCVIVCLLTNAFNYSWCCWCFFLQLNDMAVQVSIPGYQPRMRLDAPPSVYFPAQTVGGNSATAPPAAHPPSHRSAVPAVVPGVAPPSKSANTSTASSGGATGPLGSFDGRRMRSKAATRRTVDYNASLVNYVQVGQHLII